MFHGSYLKNLFKACKRDSTIVEINNFLDKWHLAAGKADANVFFNAMADNSVYIGTDASERWTKTEFVGFAKPYFDKGKAWDFKPYERDIHVTNDGNYA